MGERDRVCVRKWINLRELLLRERERSQLPQPLKEILQPLSNPEGF